MRRANRRLRESIRFRIIGRRRTITARASGGAMLRHQSPSRDGAIHASETNPWFLKQLLA
jgi:hypothetical protein